MKLTEINKIIKLCKKSGIKHIKFDGIELEFDNQKPMEFVPVSEDKEELPPTEDDMLYWSTDYDPKENENKEVVQ